ncbi:MAG TPA: hypothetical protein VGR61_01975 [Candidatus Dormibacteraeota bacterium]|nr:hypothetical protein [Candidatus Dormibacteraeota bacterium]
MPKGRPVGSRTRTPRVSTADTDRGLLNGVRGLVERNAELEAENRRLRQLLDEISRSLKVQPATPTGEATRRRGRPPKAVDPAGDAPRRRGRPRKSEAPVKVRRKITDPVVLERRRAALTKARAVRAERLAAARG